MESIGDFEYNSKDLIGHGAFAVVFKGRHKTIPDYPVAIKSITKKNLTKSQNLLGKEIKILKELTELHHENVVALLDCKETQNHVYLVMEYCNGGDLADYLHTKGTLSEDTLKTFLNQIAKAMKALYTKGIVHRDLKPQNILLCHQNKMTNPSPNDIVLKIADFGFARFLQDGRMAATLCGSPMYMAPEVIMSLQYDAKSDLWSIGTIVFQCLTGKAPFQAQTPQALKQYYEKNPNLAPKIPSGTSKELTDLLLRLLKRNAKDRMEFDEFFTHPFMTISNTASKPLFVPGTNLSGATDTSSISSSPIQSPVSYGSPVQSANNNNNYSGNNNNSNNNNSNKQENDGSTESDDFVMVTVPENEIRQVNAKRKSTSLSSSNVLPPGEPIPVPSQKKAYEQIKRSCAKIGSSKDSTNTGSGNNNSNTNNNNSSDSSNISENNNNNNNLVSPPDSPKMVRNDSKTSLGSSDGIGSRFLADISQLSPPNVQFVIGTPPGPTLTSISLSNRRRSVPISSTLLDRQTPTNQSLARQLTPPVCLNTLPKTIMGSDRQMTADQMAFKWSLCANPEHERISGGSQITPPRINKLAFGSASPKSFGLNELAFRTGNASPSSNSDKRIIHQPCHTHGSHASQIYRCCCPNTVFPPICFRNSLDATPLYLQDGNFVAPELNEETLLDKDHKETLAKLNFVLALVECIIELAENRISPIAALTTNRKEIPNECQRKAEQLVLYVRALQLLSSALQLSRQEINVGRLRASTSVRQLLRTLRDTFHACLKKCKSIDSKKLFSSTNLKDLGNVSADKIIYDYAIEMCQSAALEELFGLPEECFKRYQVAQILLHSLSQQLTDENDKLLLQKYKEAVEKRLYVLQNQGIVISYEHEHST